MKKSCILLNADFTENSLIIVLEISQYKSQHDEIQLTSAGKQNEYSAE